MNIISFVCSHEDPCLNPENTCEEETLELCIFFPFFFFDSEPKDACDRYCLKVSNKIKTNPISPLKVWTSINYSA